MTTKISPLFTEKSASWTPTVSPVSSYISSFVFTFFEQFQGDFRVRTKDFVQVFDLRSSPYRYRDR